MFNANFEESLQIFKKILKIDPNQKEAKRLLDESQIALKISNNIQNFENNKNFKEIIPLLDELIKKYSRQNIELRLKKVEFAIKIKDYQTVREEIKYNNFLK
jgi:hypothetical protein